jgi:pilus assembly protein CpaF
MDLSQVLDRSRELVRASGFEPAIAAARAVDELAEGHAELVDEERLIASANLELTGFGVLQPFLDDPSIEELWINRPGELHFANASGHQVVEADLSARQLRLLVLRMLRHSGRRLDRLTPFVDADLPDGSRLHVVTLLRALLSELSDQTRIVSCEDTFELSLEHPDWVAMRTRPASPEGDREIGLRELVRQALRMRPDRLVIGEVRGAEALDLIVALNSGIPGACTIHANSGSAAIEKLLTLPLLAGENITESFLRPTVLASLDFVVQCRQLPDGKRVVSEILELGNDRP